MPDSPVPLVMELWGRGGCLYCDAGGARASYASPELPVAEQLRRGIERSRRRNPDARFIAYFQAFTNTYAPPDQLRRIYAEGLTDPAVVAMAIGTRPDCLGEETLDILEEFAPPHLPLGRDGTSVHT